MHSEWHSTKYHMDLHHPLCVQYILHLDLVTIHKEFIFILAPLSSPSSSEGRNGECNDQATIKDLVCILNEKGAFGDTTTPEKSQQTSENLEAKEAKPETALLSKNLQFLSVDYFQYFRSHRLSALF